jgi:hypothetical protein
VGEEDTAGRRIPSASHAHRRTADSGKRRGGIGQAEGSSGDRDGRRPSGGPEWAAQASMPAGPVHDFRAGRRREGVVG